MKPKKSKSHSILDKAGLKKTNPRTVLLNFLEQNQKPLSVKDISGKLSKKGVDKVTIYRMLETMAKKGLTRRVDIGSREVHYEIVDHRKDHHHVICMECKKVSDFTGCEAQSLIKSALKQVKGFNSISHHSFDLFGLCNACAK